MYRLVPYNPADSFQIACRLRDADAAEAEAAGIPFEDALHDSIERADLLYTICLEGEPVGLFGLREVSGWPAVAVVWAVGTDKMVKYPIAFLRASLEFTQELLDVYGCLTNAVHEDNVVHYRWLEALGARIDPPDDNGFCPFTITR